MLSSHFDYCISVWGNCPKVYLDQIQRLQNRAARAVLGNFDYSASVSQMIRDLGWMRIHEPYLYHTSVLVYNCLNNLAPPRLTSKLSFVESNTRSAANSNLVVPFPHSELFRRSFAYRGPSIWNSLPVLLLQQQAASKRSASDRVPSIQQQQHRVLLPLLCR